jgi:2-dehydropantoate 2-reductase
MGILENIILQLNNSHFQFRAEENIQPLIWKKAINNCIFNSICPLLETDNGSFIAMKRHCTWRKKSLMNV